MERPTTTPPTPTWIEGLDYYYEDGRMVLTARFLLARGHCCGNGCRHCPYNPPDSPPPPADPPTHQGRPLVTVAELTREYETWLAGVIPHPLVQSDLAHKHALLSDPNDSFPFFRGTYYLWVKRWADAAGPLANAPRVLAVGDIHVENFGSWRDADGRLCWGVNDFDEVDELPYTHDLVRLATSVRFAKRGGTVSAKLGEACGAILAGYQAALQTGGMPFVLEERHPELRAMAMTADREPTKFWAKMTRLLDLPAVDPPTEAKAALEGDFPHAGLKLAFRERPQAGVGSLGRPRYAALVECRGGWVCREAKATAPPATAWGLGSAAVCRTAEAARGAVRSPDPFYQQVSGWVVRRLAPRSSRIDLSHLKSIDLGRLLSAMGAELANVHLGTATPAAILADLSQRPADWLLTAARAFADLLEADWNEWRKHKG